MEEGLSLEKRAKIAKARHVKRKREREDEEAVATTALIETTKQNIVRQIECATADTVRILFDNRIEKPILNWLRGSTMNFTVKHSTYYEDDDMIPGRWWIIELTK